MSIKKAINNPKLLQLITAILTAVLGYFGYEKVQSAPNDVAVEITVPDPIAQPEHAHKNWLPIIKSEVDKAQKKHNSEYH